MRRSERGMGAAVPSGPAEDLRALAERYRLETVGTVSDEMLDPTLVSEVPVEWARTNGLLPVRLRGELCVLTADPTQVSQFESLALLVGAPLRPVLAARDAILSGIERCYYRKDDSPEHMIEGLHAQAQPAGPVARPGDDLLRVADGAPVTQLVNLIVLQAVKDRASDIHFEPFESRLRVRYRIDGVLYEQAAPPKAMEDALVSRLKVMARMDIAEKRMPQDGMARVHVGEREIDVRVSTVPVAEGERVVLRLLDRDSALLPLEDLGMASGVLAGFRSLMRVAHGIVVVSGPTGSGKTTTLYAALRELDSTRRNILTIEDPIEYQLPDIGQIQVKPKIGLTFAHGLRHILRQDPDVVLVGETRDAETAEIAVRASLTGHLVLTTLHTNDAPGAVIRLLDMGIEPYLLSSCLRGVLAQRLVRTLCRECRRPDGLSAAEQAALGPLTARIPGGRVWVAAGCPACLEGFRGRTGIFELMVVDSAVRAAVRAGGASRDVRNLAQSRGMESLFVDGVDKIAQGVTTAAEVIGAAAAGG